MKKLNPVFSAAQLARAIPGVSVYGTLGKVRDAKGRGRGGMRKARMARKPAKKAKKAKKY